MKWILLISPEETQSCEWESREFSNKEEALDYMHNHDLTKEHWMLSIPDMVSLLRKNYDHEEELTNSEPSDSKEETQ